MYAIAEDSGAVLKAQIVHGTLISYDQEAAEAIAKHAHLEVVDFEIIKKKKRRTSQQNKAIHKWCDLLALSFNAAGITKRLTLPSGYVIETDWSMDSVKKDIWHTIQESQFGTVSTADLETAQVNKVYELIDRDVAGPMGVHVPFPRWEDMAT